ncbi:protein ABHD11-like [Dendronephthya gigantea]|uniref:protein ABHD11-like n=1 Tax=Dendronephthya gigantea TaxID=151771 RepID=UPI00106A6DCE|nr:protein ABHD11-like [Dendronephthya gigantea]
MAGSLSDQSIASGTFPLFYRIYGDERQEEFCPIVLIHGMFGSTVNWHEFCKSYRDLAGRKMISVDFRNHGRSPRSKTMTLQLMVGDVIRTLKQLNVSKAIVIGHSLGGKVAMELALNKPDSVEKLIVEDQPPATMSLGTLPMVFSAMRNLDLTKVNNSNADAMLAESIQHDISKSNAAKLIKFSWLTLKIFGSESAVIRAYLLKNLHENNEGMFHWLTDLENMYNNLDVFVDAIELNGRAPYPGETLFIEGGESHVRTVDLNEARKLFPKAKQEIIPGASHFVHNDKPCEFQEVVNKFIADS